jgi:predicted TPR repeat methyltransferase
MASKANSPRDKHYAPSDADRLAAAVRMHQLGQVTPAVAIYKKVLSDSPDHVDALHFLGVAMHQLGDHDGALAQLDRVLELAPGHPDAHNNRGNILKKLGRLDEAEAEYRRVLAERPKDSNALNNLGTVLRSRGQFEAAAAVFREVLALVPDHGSAWQNLGHTLSAMERYDEAIEAHREAVRLVPQSPSSYHHLGAVLAANGRPDEAREVFERWLARFPSDPRARHMLASCTREAAPSRASDDYVRAEFANFAATFDAKLAQLEYKAPTLIAEASARLLGEAGRASAVLDAGCGTGLCATFLRARSAHLTGVDLSPEMVDLAKERRLYDHLVVDELTAFLRKHEAGYDLIVSADTLVYFGDLVEVLGAAARALVANGVLAFTVERIAWAETTHGYRLQPSGRYAHSHEYLTATLTGAGLIDVDLREVSLRKEAGRWVEGFLVSARQVASTH